MVTDAAGSAGDRLEYRVLVPHFIDGGADGEALLGTEFNAEPAPFALLGFNQDVVHGTLPVGRRR